MEPGLWRPGDALQRASSGVSQTRRGTAGHLRRRVWCHAAFARDRHLHFPLLADFEPKGEVARKYRAYRTSEGICECALFVLDRQGTITWSYCSPIAVNPGADGILDALEKLSDQAHAHGHLENTDHAK